MALTIGRIAGIEISVHISFLVLVAIVALAATVPDQPAVVLQVAWIVVLFACVVVHELAHSLVARAHGVMVKEIELLPIGGLSKLETRPRSSRDELLIAAAGPAASIGIGAVLAGLATAAGHPPWPIALYGGSFVTRVVWLNVLLGLFNLLPALPLDGGRVLRAALTPRLGHEQATRYAVLAGRVSGYVMIAGGLLVNFWIAAIGAFVVFGAVGEEAALRLEQLLAGARVGDLPIHPAAEAPAGVPVADIDDPVFDTALVAGEDVVLVRANGVVIGSARATDVQVLARRIAGRRSRSQDVGWQRSYPDERDRPSPAGTTTLPPPAAPAQDRDGSRADWRNGHASKGR